jgi:cytochrome c oxidase assembly protein subunit 15
MSKNAPNKTNPWLFRFAVLTAFVTFLLIGLGGLVTSNNAGMSVPDWPTSYGYNMFALPIKFWKGGIFYEHTHRLLASLVGTLTAILAIWLWVRETQGRSRWTGIGAILFVFVLLGVRQMPVFLALLTISPIVIAVSLYQFSKNPKSLRWLGMCAFALVVPQGVLGGLRVVWFKDQIGIVHATIAQVFFIVVCMIALFASRFWKELSASKKNYYIPRNLRTLVLATTLLIVVQLIIAATMRHQHAGLAISDFPLAYGKIWPDTNPDAIANYNQHRVSLTEEAPVTAFQIELQMMHRVVAYTIFILVVACAWSAWKRLGGKDSLAKLAFFWLALIFAQVALGAATIWTNKAADVATAHVMVGALSLVTGALWCIIGFGRSASALPDAQTFGVFGVQTSMMANK